MSDHNGQPMSPEERAWTEYLRWTQGAATADYVEIERKAWSRLQLALGPMDVKSPEVEDALDRLAALDSTPEISPERGMVVVGFERRRRLERLTARRF